MINLVYIAIHSMVCLALVVLVLVQQGKGATTAFGTGASSTVFGSKGSNAFVVKATAFIAMLFFFSTINLNYYTQVHKNSSEIVKVLKGNDVAKANSKTNK